ncbi:protein DpdG [Roseomonas indoligenes]|uniref:Uncharacterized protein n=1 Tax=Roseomonas indoligenes TaxID=2820811 RepID=A0A940N409_9PROT|nr:protein DpdG [Pararoseomonas indoligenes]MBP0496277.1 hypothetical protein [Pararoseomonas indoligenes]
MSVISTVEATPSRLRIMFEYLEGRAGDERERLLALLAPRSLPTRSADGESSVAPNALDEALRLGLLVRDGEKIAAAGKLDPARRRRQGEREAFAALVERLLLDPAAPGAGSQRSFACAVSWLLTRSPGAPLEFSANQLLRLREDLGEDDDYELTSNLRWQNFCYWARYLGYCGFVGVGGKTLVIPDPTAAVRRHLADMLPDRGEMRIGEVLVGLATRCPVLEEGAIRREVEGRFLRLPREPSRLSQATSLALRRLQDGGLISMRALADAEARVLDFEDATDRVTHIGRTRAL